MLCRSLSEGTGSAFDISARIWYGWGFLQMIQNNLISFLTLYRAVIEMLENVSFQPLSVVGGY